MVGHGVADYVPFDVGGRIACMSCLRDRRGDRCRRSRSPGARPRRRPRARGSRPARRRRTRRGRRRGVPVSAVPVLPATVTPGICACVPVPPSTAATIMSRIAAAVFALTRPASTCAGAASRRRRRRARRPASRAAASSRCRGSRSPPATIAICSGVTSMPLLAEREAARVDLRVRVLRVERACASSGCRGPRRARVGRRLERRHRSRSRTSSPARAPSRRRAPCRCCRRRR